MSLLRTSFMDDQPIAGAGNYFCPWPTLRLFRCLASQIPFKKTIIKLKISSLRAKCGPRVVCCPLLPYSLICENLYDLFLNIHDLLKWVHSWALSKRNIIDGQFYTLETTEKLEKYHVIVIYHIWKGNKLQHD